MSRKQVKIFLILTVLIAIMLFAIRMSETTTRGNLDWPDPDTVTGLKIEHEDGRILIATRRGGDWSIEQPRRGVGNSKALEDLILMGQRVQVIERLRNGEKSHYGLHKPTVRLELRGGDAGTQIAFGDLLTQHYASYMQVDNGPILAVKGYPVETLQQPFDNFYDKKN